MNLTDYCSKIFQSEQVKSIDNFTIEYEPIKSIDLMERAAKMIFMHIADLYDTGDDILRDYVIFCGPGNNGGDGLALTRIMNHYGFGAKAYCLCTYDKLSPDNKINYDRLKQSKRNDIYNLSKIEDFPLINKKTVIIDCIFGSGLTRPVKGFYAEIINTINLLSNKKIAIDIPSGLYGEDNSKNTGAIVQADYTITLQFPFLSMMFAENNKYTGDFVSVDIGLHKDAIKKTESDYYVINNTLINNILNKRKRFDHKGDFGHAMLIAGSYGKAGAAVLAGRACLRSGVGLLTCHVPQTNNKIIQICIPEAMTSIDGHSEYISEIPYSDTFDAYGAGPGMGTNTISNECFIDFVRKCKKPLVIDADGLNILSEHENFESIIPKNSILTPHPGEFRRLFGKTENSFEVVSRMRELSQKYELIIIYKSGISFISLPDGKILFNKGGNPGMATGGSGDVLTGIILSFLAQNYEPASAAIVSVLIHSLSGDLAKKKYGEISMIASDIIEFIPEAIKATFYDEKQTT